MSNDNENSMSTIAAIGVAILLLLMILVIPAGFGLFYFSRQQAQYARAAEQMARLEAERAVAEERVQREVANVQQGSMQAATDITLNVAADGTMTVDEQKLD